MVHLSYNSVHNRMCQNEQQKIFSGPKYVLQRLDHPQESKLLKFKTISKIRTILTSLYKIESKS